MLLSLDGIDPTVITFVCVLKACGPIGDVRKGVEIHDKVLREGFLQKNMSICNALVDMYSKCGMLTKAKAVFDKLPICDTVTWNTLFTGYVHYENDEEALNAFEQMQKKRISSNSITFVGTLKASASNGAIEKGREMHVKIEEMGRLKRN